MKYEAKWRGRRMKVECEDDDGVENEDAGESEEDDADEV